MRNPEFPSAAPCRDLSATRPTLPGARPALGEHEQPGLDLYVWRIQRHHRDMVRPQMTVGAVTIAAARPRELAHFYADLLGWEVSVEEPARPGKPAEDGWAQVIPPGGRNGLALNFEFDDHYQRPVWPSRPSAQTASQHLDIGVDDLAEATAWAVQHGAVLAEHQPQETVRVLIDPDGHPFCLC
jgi:catechol 2,3-dioxygenase-like lactoylglutathione lyase family enzyme